MLDETNKNKGPVHGTRAVTACMEVGKLLTSTFNLQEILNLIMTKVSDFILAENWSLLLKDEASGDLTFEIVVGIDKDRIQGVRMARGEGIAGHVAETGERVFQPQVRQDPRFSPRIDEVTGFTTESILCVPLKTHGRILGVIEIINPKDVELFESRYLPILMTLADYAAIAIQNSRFVSRIERMSVTDEYTGLLNARYLHETLEALLQQAQEQGTSIAVVFADIDDFKQVVDTHGHLVGTQVLKEVGQTISSCLSKQDLLVKYGGDEYVIILPGKNRETAGQLAERIRLAIRESVYLKTETTPVRVTLSLGLAIYPENSRTERDLLLLADKAMYMIKDSTKDGVGTA